MAIDPEECIDCAVCVSECPVGAILAEEAVPAEQKIYVELNAKLALGWPRVTKGSGPLPDAEVWKDRTDKLGQLEI